ncbi:unnamed protein product [Notodromas monacha]|uniref:Ig-like domain-containing protein n=1 Tax=Notodromas monacha TaxID=399045 RepID=A0A7R9G9Q6_9CRUS|nr:unnamed protein product [Notodromas monacha]CAG0913178.1 unnamed protein product [Notodromas monacha]
MLRYCLSLPVMGDESQTELRGSTMRIPSGLVLFSGTGSAASELARKGSQDFARTRVSGDLRVKARVPTHAARGDAAKLHCNYETSGSDGPIYSVKWYKNENEFFRYQPWSNPPAQIFAQAGVTVDGKLGRRPGGPCWSPPRYPKTGPSTRGPVFGSRGHRLNTGCLFYGRPVWSGRHASKQARDTHSAHTQLTSSNDKMVVLRSVNLTTSGRYKCEVSTEGQFITESDSGALLVVGKAIPRMTR